ncbi:Elongation factor G [Planctomycetes bacterium Pla163]|uniref:Elongation factor G n=1 Tax=Rohdeia mirabilis TaxID=2528008 RepID=A0A518D2M3_9BACT|nr:Elongation factor G [Planctomycetes bacterium Pla163]
MSHPSPRHRNVVFIGHPGAGKTTLVDALAFAAGATERKGSVGDRTSLCDTEPEEQEKQHTLQLAVVHARHGDFDWNFVDTPGYPEFEGETRAGLFAADMAIAVVSCASGVTTNLRRKVAEIHAAGRPMAIVATHCEDENRPFAQLVEELRAAFGETCVPGLLPDLDGGRLVGVHRVIGDDQSPWRQRLMDRVIDGCEDEATVERYLESQTLTEDELRAHYPSAIAARTLVPVLCANPETGVGVDELLAFLERAAPGPMTVRGYTRGGESMDLSTDGEPEGVVFGVRNDQHLGKVCLARLLHGRLAAQSSVQAVGRDARPEKLGGLFVLMGGKNREAVTEAEAGSIVALAKVEGLEVGDTFGSPVAASAKGAVPVDFPTMSEPLVSHAIELVNRADEQKIGPALVKLASEDPTFRHRHDSLTHELVVSGMSELHLDILESRLKRRFGIEITTRPPRIAYRETVRGEAQASHRHKKQSGGRGQFGECHLRVRPAAEGSGIVFHDKVVGGAIPKNLIPAVEKGVREICSQGILTHAQVIDVEVELFDGKFHAVDSDEMSFKMAGARAFREAFSKAKPTLLEPLMELEIHVPAEHAGAVFSDLTSHRRGHVVDQSSEGDGAVTIVIAHAPLALLGTYNRDLRSMTAGAATWSMKAHGYASVPAAEQAKVLAESGKKHDDD